MDVRAAVAIAAIALEKITHIMPLSDINKAFDLMHAGKSIRSVVTF